MKKWLYIILVFQLFCVACFDDETNKDVRELNPIVIENIDLRYNSFSVYMGDTLKIEPLVFCEGIPDAKMSFEWKMFGGTIAPTVIDSTMFLSAKILAPPFSNPYTLRYTIKDETTGICRIETFNITVLSPYGEGLIVADTKNGINSDLSLVMSKQFSSQIPSTDNQMKIFRDVWSQNNGEPLPGLVLDAVTSSYGTNRSLSVLTTEHLYRADHYDFVRIPYESDGQLFQVVPPHIGHGYTKGNFVIITSTSHEIMNANGLVTPRSVQHNNRLFDYTMYPSKVNDYDITLMYAPDRSVAYAFDALGKRMLFFNYSKCWVPQEQASGSKFNVCDLSDYEPFFLGEISQGVALLAKQKSTGAYKGLVMNKLSSNGPNYAKTVFDFSSAAEIDKAKFFELNIIEDVVYYATETTLYTTPTVNINAQPQWTVGQGEKITGIKIYDWAGGNRDHESIGSGGDIDKVSWGSQNRMIMIFTYNESAKEGKVICVPIVTLGVGGLEQNKGYHIELSKFGKILGVYKQKK